MYLWWSLCTLHLHECQVRVTIGDSGFCCVCMTYIFPALINSLVGWYISFVFHFVLSENNLKIISTQLLEKWWTFVLCSGSTSLTLNCPKIQCWDYTKHTTETGTTAARGCEICMCHEESRTARILFWQTNEPQNMSKNIYNNFLFCFVFCMLKIWAYLSYKQTGPLYNNNPCERPTSQDPPLSYTSETHAWLSRPAQKKG